MIPDIVLIHAPAVYDFRSSKSFFGPISDAIPATTAFEMYPIGFSHLVQALSKAGLDVRVSNIAMKMVHNRNFDVEKYIRCDLSAHAFAIDLHWMVHCHGSIEIAKLLKKYHRETPVIFGGLSASYFYDELISYPFVDYVIRGDSAELPLLQLLNCIKRSHQPLKVPNLIWKNGDGIIENPFSYVPDSLDPLSRDLGWMIKNIIKYKDFWGTVPFRGWLNNPVSACFSSRGCTQNCITCGLSAKSARYYLNRQQPALRSPKNLYEDIRHLATLSRQSIVVSGDIRKGGASYVEEFLFYAGKQPVENNVVFHIEIGPAEQDFFKKLSEVFESYSIIISPESHDDEIRKAYGRNFTTSEFEDNVRWAIENGAKLITAYFMIGLPRQTYQSVIDTVGYIDSLLKWLGSSKSKVEALVIPMAPFLDIGSIAYRSPEKHGYRLRCLTLEDHRKALMSPTWKNMFNYETECMDIHQLVDVTYDSTLKLIGVKEKHGLVSKNLGSIIRGRVARSKELEYSLEKGEALASETYRFLARARKESLLHYKSRLWIPSAGNFRTKNCIKYILKGSGGV